MNNTASDLNSSKTLTVEQEIRALEEINVMSSVEEIKKLFLKEFLLVFYHPDVHTEIMKEYCLQLKQICEIKTFEDWREAADFIENSHTQTDFSVVTSEANGEIFLDKIVNQDNVFSMTVLCLNGSMVIPWIRKYIGKKSTSIQPSFQVLKIWAQKEVIRWQRDSYLRLNFPVFAPIFDDYERSENNYLYFYLTELVKFGNREQSKKDFLSLARNLYRDTHNMNDFEKDYNDYHMANILRWYTKESFVYKLANNCLRLAKPDTVYYSRFILKDLEAAIKERYWTKSHHFSGLLHRAAYITKEEWVRLEQNQEKEIEMYGFLSTTKNKNVAETFAQEDRDQKAVITIVVPELPDHEGQGFAEVAEYSLYSEEEEILFNVRSRFTILKVGLEDIDGVTYRHLILLYGAQEIRRFISKTNPVIEINLTDVKRSQCGICTAEIELEKSCLFINLKKTDEHICYRCVKKASSLDMPALACIKGVPNAELKVEGMSTLR